MKSWKIYNKSNSDVKLSIRIENTKVIGIFLKPNHFVVGMPSMTAQIDAQRKRDLINIEENFDNSYFQFVFGEQYEQSNLEGLKNKKLEEMKKEELENLIVSLTKETKNSNF